MFEHGNKEFNQMIDSSGDDAKCNISRDRTANRQPSSKVISSLDSQTVVSTKQSSLLPSWLVAAERPRVLSCPVLSRLLVYFTHNRTPTSNNHRANHSPTTNIMDGYHHPGYFFYQSRERLLALYQ